QHLHLLSGDRPLSRFSRTSQGLARGVLVFSRTSLRLARCVLPCAHDAARQAPLVDPPPVEPTGPARARPVVLVHGIWKSGASFARMAKHLGARGFAT